MRVAHSTSPASAFQAAIPGRWPQEHLDHHDFWLQHHQYHRHHHDRHSYHNGHHYNHIPISSDNHGQHLDHATSSCTDGIPSIHVTEAPSNVLPKYLTPYQPQNDDYLTVKHPNPQTGVMSPAAAVSHPPPPQQQQHQYRGGKANTQPQTPTPLPCQTPRDADEALRLSENLSRSFQWRTGYLQGTEERERSRRMKNGAKDPRTVNQRHAATTTNTGTDALTTWTAAETRRVYELDAGPTTPRIGVQPETRGPMPAKRVPVVPRPLQREPTIPRKPVSGVWVKPLPSVPLVPDHDPRAAAPARTNVQATPAASRGHVESNARTHARPRAETQTRPAPQLSIQPQTQGQPQPQPQPQPLPQPQAETYAERYARIRTRLRGTGVQRLVPVDISAPASTPAPTPQPALAPATAPQAPKRDSTIVQQLAVEAQTQQQPQQPPVRPPVRITVQPPRTQSMSMEVLTLFLAGVEAFMSFLTDALGGLMKGDGARWEGLRDSVVLLAKVAVVVMGYNLSSGGKQGDGLGGWETNSPQAEMFHQMCLTVQLARQKLLPRRSEQSETAQSSSGIGCGTISQSHRLPRPGISEPARDRGQVVKLKEEEKKKQWLLWSQQLGAAGAARAEGWWCGGPDNFALVGRPCHRVTYESGEFGDARNHTRRAPRLPLHHLDVWYGGCGCD
ncbi:hypothetical protein K490DRAFT_60260 [Saccharata proteae CBS 121410]|uniref:Uncharacterized protein n=1 Tax=Saccharata proteae CBS 121410 TaxID=1314787 RepID=A0A9P4HLA9_9PEZI|nr:hypothetical protein K490DRAFT_60260 [Saccharata proteae CBS 121410]